MLDPVRTVTGYRNSRVKHQVPQSVASVTHRGRRCATIRKECDRGVLLVRRREHNAAGVDAAPAECHRNCGLEH